MSGESRYIRVDVEINRLRSGMGDACAECDASLDMPCTGSGGKPLMYNHASRRKAGKAAADALVIARGKKAQ